MRITERKLRRIIREETKNLMTEGAGDYGKNLPGDLAKWEVVEKWKELQRRDRSINGAGPNGGAGSMGSDVQFIRKTEEVSSHREEKLLRLDYLDKHEKYDGPFAIKVQVTDSYEYASGRKRPEGSSFWMLCGWAPM